MRSRLGVAGKTFGAPVIVGPAIDKWHRPDHGQKSASVMRIGCADDPPADPGRPARRWDDADGVIDMNHAGPYHPAIQRELPSEDVTDAAEHVEVLLAAVGVD